MVQGIIDACFEEDGALVLVDYKTDSVAENVKEVFQWLISDFGKYDKENFIPAIILKEQNNKIENYCSGTSSKLNNIVFITGRSGYSFSNYQNDGKNHHIENIFKKNCLDIMILQESECNYFDKSCDRITFGGKNNKFSYGTSKIFFDHACESNIFNNTSYVKFVGKYRRNTINNLSSWSQTINSDNIDNYVQYYVLHNASLTNEVLTSGLNYETIQMSGNNGLKEFCIADIPAMISNRISESITNVLNTEV